MGFQTKWFFLISAIFWKVRIVGGTDGKSWNAVDARKQKFRRGRRTFYFPFPAVIKEEEKNKKGRETVVVAAELDSVTVLPTLLLFSFHPCFRLSNCHPRKGKGGRGREICRLSEA